MRIGLSNQKWISVPNFKYAFFRGKLDIVIVSLIGLIQGFCLIGSTTDSLGTTSLDDSPVLPSLTYKYPENFTNDLMSARFRYLMWTSSTKWLPALLYKYVNIDPVFFHMFFTYAQTVLILVGIFTLTKVLFQSRLSAFISVLFTINFSPFFNNFGWYGDEFFMPYPTWCSIGPLLLSWSYGFQGKIKKQFVWTLIGSSIHPSMGLCSATLVYFTCFTKNADKKKNFKNVGISFAPAACFAILAWIVSVFNAAPTPHKQWNAGLTQVVHWFAWKLNPTSKVTNFEQSAYAITLMICGVILANIFFKATNMALTQKVNAIFAIFCSFYAIQALAYQFKIRSIYSISLGRVSIFTSIFVVSLISGLFTKIINNEITFKKILHKFFILTLILVPSFLNIFILSIFAWFQNLYLSKKGKAILGFFSITILLLLFANYSHKWFRIPTFLDLLRSTYEVPNYFILVALKHFLGEKTFLLYLFFMALLLILIKINNAHKVQPRTFTKILISVVVIVTLATSLSRIVQTSIRNESSRQWIKLQDWVQTNTDFGTKFIVAKQSDTYQSWSTLTRRAKLQTFDEGSGFLYIYSKDDAEFDKKRKILGPSPIGNENSDIIENFYLKFADIFGGDYYVQPSKDTKLSWKVVYRAADFTIYEIPAFLK